jgi:hypothetical protein
LRKSLIESLKSDFSDDLKFKFVYQLRELGLTEKIETLKEKIKNKEDLSNLFNPSNAEFSTKDLFLIYALSFEKKPIKIEDFSMMFHQLEFRSALLDVVKMEKPVEREATVSAQLVTLRSGRDGVVVNNAGQPRTIFNVGGGDMIVEPSSDKASEIAKEAGTMDPVSISSSPGGQQVSFFTHLIERFETPKTSNSR